MLQMRKEKIRGFFLRRKQGSTHSSLFYQQTLSLERNIRRFGINYDIYIDNLHSGLLRFQLLPSDSRGGQHELSDRGGKRALISTKEISVFEEKKVKLNNCHNRRRKVRRYFPFLACLKRSYFC